MKKYYNDKNTGGPYLSKGIAYQDLVSLYYLFNNISNPTFQEIMFEMKEDFSLKFNDSLNHIQVKNIKLTLPVLIKYLEETDFSKERSYMFIASSKDNKIGKLTDKHTWYLNAMRSTFEDSEKKDITAAYACFLEKLKLTKLLDIDLEFDFIPEVKLDKLVKLGMYEWCQHQGLKVDHNLLFNKLMTLISSELRPNRKSLNMEEIKSLLRESYKTFFLAENNYYDKSVEIKKVNYMLDEDIIKYSKYKNELMQIKYYINENDGTNAHNLIFEISEYEFRFHKYLFWMLFHDKKYDEIEVKATENLKTENEIYLSNYYLALVYQVKGEYLKAIDHAICANSKNNNCESNLLLAKLYIEIDDIIVASDYLKKCLFIQDNNLEANFLMGMISPYPDSLKYFEKVINLDNKYASAYLELGKIERYFGNYSAARKWLTKYIRLSNSKEGYRELGFCLLNMGKKESKTYLIDWLKLELFSSDYLKLPNDKVLLIIDIEAERTNTIMCKRSFNDFIITINNWNTKLLNLESIIKIGVIRDDFLHFSNEFFKEHGHDSEPEDSMIPCLIKEYPQKDDFNLIMNLTTVGIEHCLNKDYRIPLKNGEVGYFKEYIVDNANIEIVDRNNLVNVTYTLNGQSGTGEFRDFENGYFAFKDKVNNPKGNPFKEAVIIYYCYESKEQINFKFPLERISINLEFMI